MASVRAALAEATTRLAPLSDTPRLDAELLMAHALDGTREEMLLRQLDAPAPESFRALLARRLAHEPVAYITGTRDFWTISLHVAPGVLIPRADSETLIEAAIGHFKEEDPKSILDLGTGSGALLLAALSEWPEARALGIDVSATALKIATGNAKRLGLKAEFRAGDWCAGIDETFDLILCNPPYVDRAVDLPPQVALYEPHGALFADNHGIADYQILAPQIAKLIAPGGCAVVEIGHDQAAAVTALFEAAGLTVVLHRDLAGRDRCLLMTHSATAIRNPEG
jgi:release factor glutamine methyltransferase